MKTIRIAYIGGGSKDWAHKYFADLLTQDLLCGQLALFDIDMPAARRNKRYFDKLVRDNPARVKSAWECSVTDTIEQALAGADFVVISILPYSLKNMKVDVHYPEKYGIWQSVGDTTGPGGYSRALRTIAYFRHFAAKIRECCPDAWVINYTNPLAMCVNTLYREFPAIKAFGCCHEVFGAQSLLAGVYGMYSSLSEAGKKSFLAADLEAVKSELKVDAKQFGSPRHFKTVGRNAVKVNVQGINHFTWFDKAEIDGLDLLPLYAAYIKMFRANNLGRLGPFVPGLVKRKRNEESVKYALFEQYGRVAAAGDRHLAEFVPAMFLADKHVLKDGFFLTPVNGRILYNALLKTRTKLLNLPLLKAKLKTSGEEGVRQMTALCGLGDMRTNINMPNRGQAPNLVMGTAVETNALISLDSAVPVNAGDMSEETAELVNIHAQNQKDFVDAYFEKDKSKLLAVFLNDPAVQRIGAENGKRLFEEMIRLNAACLEDFLLQ